MSVRRLWLVARNELSFNARRPMFYICLVVIGLIVLDRSVLKPLFARRSRQPL